MRLKAAFSILTLLGLPLLISGSAAATTNIFLPISGAAFSTATFGTPLAYGDDGTVTAQVSNHHATASLGHALGGLNNFTVYVQNIGLGNVLTCTVFLRRTNNLGLNPIPFSNSTSVVGTTSFTVVTNAPAGDYLYSIGCTLPAFGSSIFGVVPNH